MNKLDDPKYIITVYIVSHLIIPKGYVYTMWLTITNYTSQREVCKEYCPIISDIGPYHKLRPQGLIMNEVSYILGHFIYMSLIPPIYHLD